MNKQPIKIYLSKETLEQLKAKAIESGFEVERGWLSDYLTWLAKKDIAFLDTNLKKVASLFKVERRQTK